jgi:cellulose synthase/poly-beta-1,6-N-acetylglucosamine synthase-like glycosyltransferase/GGDEF domain-containing protein
MPLRSPLIDETAPLRRIAADHPGLRSPAEWLQDADRVLARPRRSRRPPAVVALHIVEHDRIETHFGRRGLDELLSQIAWIVEGELTDADRMGTDGRGGLTVLLSNTATAKVHERLERVIRRLARRELLVDGERVRITPVLGWTSAADGPPSERRDLAAMAGRAAAAADAAQQQMDLVPRRWTPEMSAPPSHDSVRRPAQLTTALQVLATFAVGIGLPLILLMTAHLLGVDLAMPAYYAVMAALVFTATVIWMENFRALDPPRPPERPAGPYPRASVIIPAYLPNEAATIIETLRYVRAQDYPGPLQVILAYNTPQPLQVEDELKAMAALDRRLVVMQVPFSTSKAQNVNAALQVVNGEFTAIFDADHHPRRDALTRAWRWISHGADVVQGHCVVRNGRASLVARTVAVEFESIYAVSHPGRAGLHGFGVFGGSNGYWRTSVLHETRMRAEMLTEDIDSSIRLILHGYTVVNDSGLLSYELAPATFGALWHQRIRWAQGWFQVARRHLQDGLRSDLLSMRNRFGMAFLLGWREVYPWISLLIVPVIVFMAWRRGGITQLDFLVPSLVLASLYTFAIGPAQALFAWRLAAPEVRRNRRWFFCYLLLAPAYTELRNVIARVAQLKELTGERRWVITPRPQAAPSGPVGS